MRRGVISSLKVPRALAACECSAHARLNSEEVQNPTEVREPRMVRVLEMRIPIT